MTNPVRNFTSIWNENPELYLGLKTVYSAAVTIFYPLAYFCVLKKSPESFGSLKWFLLFHLICLSTSWISNFLLIDHFYFMSTLVVRIDGLFAHFADSLTLYFVSLITSGISLASSQLIFCNRVFLVVNMYRTMKSLKQTVLEVLVYIFVGLCSLILVPIVWVLTPDQEKAKNDIMKYFNVYPTCVYEESSVIICNPMNRCGMILAVVDLVNVVLSTSVIFSATHLANRLLNKRSMLESEHTLNMHKKFHRRTFLQAIVVFLFAMLPLIIISIILLSGLETAHLSYSVDFLQENQPNASLLTLFLFYDPYKLYICTLLEHCRERLGFVKAKPTKVSLSAKSAVVKNKLFS